MGAHNQNNHTNTLAGPGNFTSSTPRHPLHGKDEADGPEKPLRIILCGFTRLHAAGMERLIREIDRPMVVRSESEEESPVLSAADLVVVNLQKRTNTRFRRLLSAELSNGVGPILALYDPSFANVADALLRSGNQVRGVLPANASVPTLILAIKAILAGKTVDPGSASVKYATSVPPSGKREATVVNENGKAIKLTPRQMQVLESLAQGKPNKIIARDLKVSENTIKAHLKSVFRILGASNRTEAVAHASRLNLEIS